MIWDILKSLLDEMDVPNERKRDIGWLIRNLAVRNREHAKFNLAMNYILEIKRRGVCDC